MPWIAPVVMAAGQIGGGLIANKKASKDRDEANRLINQSVAEFEAMGIPPIEAQQLALEKYKSSGNLTATLEDAVSLGDSNYGGISTDPRYKQAQLDSLDSLTGIERAGGLNLTDRANLEKILGNINADERGAREAILADSRSKGSMGSGSELVAQLMNQQDASTKAHSQGLSIAAQAQQRALDAIEKRGRLGGDVRGQEYDEQAKVAAAQDAINRWNAENMQNTRGANVNRMNTAQQYNLEKNQNLMNQNVDLSNKEQIHNKGLYQTHFDNQMDLNKAKSNVRTGAAQNFNTNAQRTADMWNGIGTGVSQTAGSIGNANYRQKQMDTDEQRYKQNMDLEYKKIGKKNPYA